VVAGRDSEPPRRMARPAGVLIPDRDRFEAAFEAHHPVVLGYALRRSATEQDAEDAVADTFAIAWRRVDRLPDPADALPWLLAIARRVLANQRRSIGRRLRLVVRLRVEERASAPTPPASGPAIDALDRLPPDDRELLRLLAWDGLTQAEAGVVLGMSANAVAIRLHRARRRFADELGRQTLKGSAPSRTSHQVEGNLPGPRSTEKGAT
jgi:DNA-directed RNA polymerase specialized sigma24 family protein